MLRFYRHFLPGLSKDSARLHAKKHEAPWIPMSKEYLEDFYNIKDKLINSEALASPDLSDLDKYPLIIGIGLLCQSDVCYHLPSTTLSGWSVQKNTAVLFGEKMFGFRTELVVPPWRVSNIHLTSYAWLLKWAPFLLKTDLMSVCYIENMKTLSGVHARWSEIIGSYSFFNLAHKGHSRRLYLQMSPVHLPEA